MRRLFRCLLLHEVALRHIMTNSKHLASKSAQVVQAALEKVGANFNVVELTESTRTAQDAANALDCNIAQIIKSLVFRTVTSNKPILVLASGINRVNEKTIGKEVGEKIVKAEADFIREVTGFAIGGIPPVGHKQVIETLIDEDLLKLDLLWAAAGTPHAVFKLKASNLVSLTCGKVISVK